MPLTLEQALFLILTIAAALVAVHLIRLFSQLRRTAAEGEKALADIGELARELRELDLIVKNQVGELGQTLAAAKKAALSMSEASFLVTSRIVRPSARFLPLIIPVARFVWRQVRKPKERKHGQ